MNAKPEGLLDPEKEPDISILCVEDDATTREFLCTILSLKFPSHKVHAAENGLAGLELFRKTRAEVVLTDISMPVMDGIRMAREIRLLNPEAFIFALSAHSRPDCPQSDLELLFTRYLLKPINSKLLCDAIGECLDQVRRDRIGG